MAFTRSQSQQQAISKKRRRGQEHMQIDEKRLSGNGCINELPDHLLINILSRVGIEEAAKTSVLAHRWRYLWRFAHGILRFGNRNSATREFMKRETFDSWVNAVLKSHKAKFVEGVVIELEEQREQYWIDKVLRDLYPVDSKMYDTLVYFAMRKQVEHFELNLLHYDRRYKFPSVARLISRSHGVSCRLRTFRLSNVSIDDKVVHYFLASCPNLEELSMHNSIIENLQVIDPPSLKVLKISKCLMLKKLVISAATLVSLTYIGLMKTLHMKKVPNLREISVPDCMSASLLLNPKRHHMYSAQLEKIVMDFRFGGHSSLCVYPFSPQDHFRSLKRLEVFAIPERTLLVFTLSIKKACPQLREFRIEMSYSDCGLDWQSDEYCFVPPALDKSRCMDFVHMNLKVVEIGGYRGDRGEERLVLGLIKTCPSIEKVVIDTEIDYFDLPYYTFSQRADKRVLPPAFFERQTEGAQNRAKERAKRFASKIPQQIKFLVI